MTEHPHDESLNKALIVAQLVDDQKAENIMVLDVDAHCSFADCFVLATCLSGLQLRGLGHRIERALREIGHRAMNASGYDSGNWVVLDFGDVIVHLFTPEGRDHYRIEDLWSKAPRIDWQQPAQSGEAPDAEPEDSKQD